MKFIPNVGNEGKGKYINRNQHKYYYILFILLNEIIIFIKNY